MTKCVSIYIKAFISKGLASFLDLKKHQNFYKNKFYKFRFGINGSKILKINRKGYGYGLKKITRFRINSWDDS